MKKQIGVITLLLSIIFLSTGIKGITGNIIKEYFQETFLHLHFVGLILLFISIFLFISKKSLDAIIIPTAGRKEEDLERTKRAEKEKTEYYLISGEKEKDKQLKETSRAVIYKELRKYGIKPSQIKIEGKSGDTLENILYSLKKLKAVKKIGIASYPGHLKRFKYIINKAKDEGIIPADLKVTYFPTKETLNEKAYGLLALLKEKYKLRQGINKAKEHKTGWLGNSIKKVLEIFD